MSISRDKLEKRYKGLIGRRFDRWEVIGPIVVGSEVGRKGDPTRVLCRCLCGSERYVAVNTLVAGTSRSCGCFVADLVRARHSQETLDESKLRRRYRTYISGARARSINFEITYDEYKDLTDGPCHYCGTDDNAGPNGNEIRMGLDRFDNDVGYTYSNLVRCCHTCNRAKFNMSANEFLSWVSRVHEHSNPSVQATRLSPQEAADYVGGTILERAA